MSETSDFNWPESTVATRWNLGCYGKEFGNHTECWCGYRIIDEYGTCPQCTLRANGMKGIVLGKV